MKKQSVKTILSKLVDGTFDITSATNEIMKLSKSEITDTTKFSIDFFEFSFLVEACIPPRPIARACFWNDVIDIHYYRLSDNERSRLHEWVNRNGSFEDSLTNKNEQCELFNARFDPTNQYLITTDFNGDVTTTECFLFNERYYITSNRSVNEDYIKEIKKK